MSRRTQSITILALAYANLLVPELGGTAEPKDKEMARTALYHRDHRHLWNRVHAALLIRTGPDNHTYGEDRLEPLLWNESEYLLRGRADRAMAVLEELLREKGESLIENPVKLAVLKRDLWLVFNWLEHSTDAPEWTRIRVPLAKAIDQLALAPEQITKLPDNYAATVASKKYADRFDPEKPEQSYLPPDLFEPNGTWVCVGRTDRPTAPQHVNETYTNGFTNSVFLVFVKLPGGRDATLDYLKRLAVFDKPLALPNADENSRRSFPFLSNPAVPQFPKGTEVALVLRALLIDSSRRVVPSPLTESIQLRVMRADTPAVTSELLDRLNNFSPAGLRWAGEWQAAFFDFQLRRADLFPKEAGACPGSANSRPASCPTHVTNSSAPTGKFPQRSQQVESNRASYALRHQLPGVYGFNSLQQGSRAGIVRDDDKLKPHPLAAMKVDEVEKAAIKWKEYPPNWALQQTAAGGWEFAAHCGGGRC